MSFIIYDLVFLAVFCLLIAVFLYRRRNNLKRQGLIYLYPTKFGIKLINHTAKKFGFILRPMRYLVLLCGYALMAGVIWMIVRLAQVYLGSPEVAQQLKIPVVMPLIPYLPELFNLDFLPPFYFTYWIIIIAIIAIPHEFAHGIYARLANIKIKSTGFGFLGPFLAAFVDPEEKSMNKSSKLSQLSILAAGTFANILCTILFIALMWVFFFAAFSPAGVYFNSYSMSVVNVSEISSVNGINISSFSQFPALSGTNMTPIQVNGVTYYTSPAALHNSVDNNLSIVYVYENSPAFQAKLSGAIAEIDGVKTQSYTDLRAQLASKSPGEEVTIKTLQGKTLHEYNLTLANNNGTAYLGIARTDTSVIKGGFFSRLSIGFYKTMDPINYNKYFNGIAYSSGLGDFGIFVYNLLWWVALICFSVALINMLPLGIFDGGRFFLITVWGITGSKRVGEIAYKISTWALLLLVVAFMLQWVFAVF